MSSNDDPSIHTNEVKTSSNYWKDVIFQEVYGGEVEYFKFYKIADKLKWIDQKGQSWRRNRSAGIMFVLIFVFLELFIYIYLLKAHIFSDSLIQFLLVACGLLTFLSLFLVIIAHLSLIDLKKQYDLVSEEYDKETAKITEHKSLDLRQPDDSGYFDDLVKINLYNLKEYYTLVKIHTNKSFYVALISGVFGFILISLGLIFGFATRNNQIAYIATASGVIIEFISGVFFYLYNKTIFQLKEYHDSLLNVQNILLSFKLVKDLEKPEERDKTTNQMITFLVGGAKK